MTGGVGAAAATEGRAKCRGDPPVQGALRQRPPLLLWKEEGTGIRGGGLPWETAAPTLQLRLCVKPLTPLPWSLNVSWGCTGAGGGCHLATLGPPGSLRALLTVPPSWHKLTNAHTHAHVRTGQAPVFKGPGTSEGQWHLKPGLDCDDHYLSFEQR